MGYRVERRTARLRLEEPFEGAEIVARLGINTEMYLAFSRLQEAANAAAVDEGARGEAMRELVVFFAQEIAESWNLEDATGAPLPLTAETMLRELPVALSVAIIDGWAERVRRDTEIAAPLGAPSSAGGTSAVAPA